MKTAWPVEQWVSLIYSGRSMLSIAKEYGVGVSTVSSQLSRAGCQKPVWNMPALSQIDAVWIAAVIDCEGTLTIHTPLNKYRNGRNIQVFARVDMSDEPVPRRLYELCAGSFKPLHRRASDNPMWKGHSYWNISSNGLRWLLPQIHPYFIVKKRHSEIVQEVLRRNRRGMRRDQMCHAELYPLIAEIRSLNKGGSHAHLDKILPRTSEVGLEVDNRMEWGLVA